VTLHVVYRSTGGENSKARPRFYGKTLALLSLLRALERTGATTDVVFLNDGPIPAPRLELMCRSGRVRQVAELPLGVPDGALRHTTSGSVGLTRSYLAALALPRDEGWSGEDVVYYVEDDYLHAPDAIELVAEAAAALPAAAYLAPTASVNWRRSDPLHAPGATWFTAESSTSTFAARVRTLAADHWIHVLSFFAGGTGDRSACQAYSGERPFRWNHLAGDALGWGPYGGGALAGRAKRAALQAALNALATRRGFARHLLVTPRRPLALHMELDDPGTHDGGDPARWEQVAADTRAWAGDRGLGDDAATALPTAARTAR
jgi:hypothetical protein